MAVSGLTCRAHLFSSSIFWSECYQLSGRTFSSIVLKTVPYITDSWASLGKAVYSFLKGVSYFIVVASVTLFGERVPLQNSLHSTDWPPALAPLTSASQVLGTATVSSSHLALLHLGITRGRSVLQLGYLWFLFQGLIFFFSDLPLLRFEAPSPFSLPSDLQ